MAGKLRRELFERRLADWLFYLLLVAAVIMTGWLGARHDRYWDWTASGRNTLSAESAAILAGLDAPLRITVFLDRAHALAKRTEQLLARYRQTPADIAVSYVDPQLFPEQARAAEVSLLGQMLLEYQGRRETLRAVSEEALTGAIARLSRARVAWVAALEGHGERRIDGEAGPDLGRLAQLLRSQGARLQPLDLATQPAVPDNTGLLLLSTPAISVFPGEVQRLIGYLERGGNLLWLMDPDGLGGLEGLAHYLGIEPLPGILVDANVHELNIDDPTVAMVADYANHPATRGLAAPALFPGSLAYRTEATAGWTLATPLQTQENSWNETGPIRGEVTRDGSQDEQAGPLPLALALTRAVPENGREQRLLILGDGDFLSNAHLDNAGNRELGLRLVQWLSAPRDEAPVLERALADRELNLTRTQMLVMGGGSLVVLPALFLTLGLVIRWRRRRP